MWTHEESTIQGNKYFITFIDDYSRRSCVYFIKAKSEALDKFLEFKASVENEIGRRIKVLRSDRGGEYLNEKLKITSNNMDPTPDNSSLLTTAKWSRGTF